MGPLAAARRFLRLTGRSSRRPYWITVLALVAALVAIAALVFVVFLAETGVPEETSARFFLATIVVGALYNLLLVPVTVRRLHDRDRSAWWLIPYVLVPFLLGDSAGWRSVGLAVDLDLAAALDLVAYGLNLLVFVDLGLLRGTRGPNRYGPDPLDPDAVDPRDAAVFD